MLQTPEIVSTYMAALRTGQPDPSIVNVPMEANIEWIFFQGKGTLGAILPRFVPKKAWGGSNEKFATADGSIWFVRTNYMMHEHENRVIESLLKLNETKTVILSATVRGIN